MYDSAQLKVSNIQQSRDTATWLLLVLVSAPCMIWSNTGHDCSRCAVDEVALLPSCRNMRVLVLHLVHLVAVHAGV